MMPAVENESSKEVVGTEKADIIPPTSLAKRYGSRIIVCVTAFLSRIS